MRRLLLLPLLASLATGCADSVIADIQPANNETVTVVGDSFAYIATNLENVSDRVSYTFNNPLERLTVIHQSFLPHGYALMVIQDASGTVTDSTLLEYQLTTQSRAGVPGVWTVHIIYTGAWGRAQFSLVPLTGDPVAGVRVGTGPEQATEAEDRRAGGTLERNFSRWGG
jgi:hypothetical protein